MDEQIIDDIRPAKCAARAQAQHAADQRIVDRAAAEARNGRHLKATRDGGYRAETAPPAELAAQMLRPWLVALKVTPSTYNISTARCRTLAGSGVPAYEAALMALREARRIEGQEAA